MRTAWREDAEAADPAAASFTLFFDAEFPGQLRRAAFLLREREAAEDVVHDAFSQVWRRWDTIAEPGPYLSRCVLNGCRAHANARRTRLRPGRANPAFDPDASVDPAFVELHDILMCLPFNQRCAVVLRFYAGMSNEEIADAMGCPIGSVGPWIQRAKQRLLEELT
jgi:RNA polymerase sigma factor (sigma-70 family)